MVRDCNNKNNNENTIYVNMLNTYVIILRPSASCVFRERDVVSFGKCHMNNETWATKDSTYLFDFYFQTTNERATYSSATVYCAVK